MTNSCGRSFLSYRRSQHVAAKLVIEAQREFGIPTWQDVDDLESAPLESELRSQLRDPNTANAVWLMTPDVSASPIIRTIELPCSLERQRVGDGFFIKPVLAQGLDYAEAAALLEGITLDDLEMWNLTRVGGEVTPRVAADIAESVLKHRLRRISASGAESPFRVGVYTRAAPELDHERALTFDWTHRFNDRTADHAAWRHCAGAAFRAVAAIRRLVPGRAIELSGLASLPGCVLMGSAFLQPLGMDVHWLQRTGIASTRWSLAGPVDHTGFHVTTRPGSVTANDVAILGSVNRLVESTVAKSGMNFRAIVEVQLTEGMGAALTPQQGVAIAHSLMNAARKARDEFRVSGGVHLFLAVPAALAFMIGQLLNTFGYVHTYEYIAESDIYQPAITLMPSSAYSRK